MSSTRRFIICRLQKALRKILVSDHGIEDIVLPDQSPFSISFGEISRNQVQDLLSKQNKVHKSSNKKEDVPFSSIPSAKNILLAVACPEQQQEAGPQIYSVHVAPGVSDMEWKKELATLQAELDTIESMVGLNDKVVVGAKREMQRNDEAKGEIKTEVLLQRTREEIKILTEQCEDLIEQHVGIQRKLQPS
jgi:hypothetical protein